MSIHLRGEIYDYWRKTVEFKLSEEEGIVVLTYAMIVSAFITFMVLKLSNMRISYGRYSHETYFSKCSISARAAWIIQEMPSVIIPLISLWLTRKTIKWPNFSVVLLFLIHYIHRTFIYGFRIRGGKATPFHVLICGIIFTLWNGYIQGFYHAKYAVYSSNFFYSFRCIFGLLFFLYGMTVNIHSDNILRNLRAPGETGYKIPYGGLFEYVSGANFFGENVEWFGYALYANTYTALAFSIFTMANTIPRALQHHKWYQKKFDDYPMKDRKAIIPFVL